MYTFKAAVPADAKGTFAVGMEGRRVESILSGTEKQQSVQYGAKNPVMYFSVDGSPVQARREPTANANCLNCHARLALHGENRVDNIEYCQFCHNRANDDSSQRNKIGGTPQTIDFKFLVHRIHGGETLATNYGVNYQVAAYGGNLTSFADVRFPTATGESRINECFACHVNGSENPSDAQLNEATVKTPQYPLTTMPATTTACYGCHASNSMLSHALTNTTQLGESCSTCHSSDSAFAASKMHIGATSVDAGQAKK
jgi:OmcA/MtrC family decaheme c-type cytochrome